MIDENALREKVTRISRTTEIKSSWMTEIVTASAEALS